MNPCGPVGSLCCFFTSAFGVFFLSLLGYLINHDYPHVGEWYDVSSPGHASYTEQKAKTVHDIWVTVAAYGAFAVVSGAAICYNRAAGRL